MLERQKCKLISEATTLFCLTRKSFTSGNVEAGLNFHLFFLDAPWQDLLTSTCDQVYVRLGTGAALLVVKLYIAITQTSRLYVDVTPEAADEKESLY